MASAIWLVVNSSSRSFPSLEIQRLPPLSNVANAGDARLRELRFTAGVISPLPEDPVPSLGAQT
jgi:hypothetical protein